MNKIFFSQMSWTKIFITLVWLVLFLLLLKRDVFIDTINLEELQHIRLAESEEYQGIYFKDNKIGYAINRYTSGENEDQKVEQEAQIKLNIAGEVQPIRLHLKATLTSENFLQDFSFSFQSPFYQMQADGVVDGNNVSYHLRTGTTSLRDTVIFSSPPLLATSRRAYLFDSRWKIGEKRRIPWFDPLSLTNMEAVLEYRGQDSVLIGGRVQKLHHFVELISGTRVNSWLNDSGSVVKEESPSGFVFQKEPKFRAIGPSGGGEELLSAMSVKLQGELGDITGPSKTYRLTIPEGHEFELDGGRQVFQGDILTVVQEKLPYSAENFDCHDADAYLLSSPHIQADHPEIIELENNITANTTQPLEKIRLLAAWIFENVEKRPVLGFPDAITTLHSRLGDCNEHAVLFAALARAAKIPTRIASGVTYHQEAFYYHAWNEVCINKQWISIDTTTNQFPTDLTHLRFVIGETQKQVRLGSLLGSLSIEPFSANGD